MYKYDKFMRSELLKPESCPARRPASVIRVETSILARVFVATGGKGRR